MHERRIPAQYSAEVFTVKIFGILPLAPDGTAAVALPGQGSSCSAREREEVPTLWVALSDGWPKRMLNSPAGPRHVREYGVVDLAPAPRPR